MTAFWIAAAALAALGWLMLAAPGPVQQATGATRAPARRLRAWLGVAAAVFSFGVYGFLGNMDALKIEAMQTPAMGPASAQPTPPGTAAADPPAEAVQTMLDAMVSRMQAQPAGSIDAAGWTMVARSYASIRRYDDASRAYALAMALTPDDAALQAEQAQVLKAAQAGDGATRFGDVVSGTVALSPELAAAVRPTDTVFVFAREAGGTGMPIAAARYSGAQWPLSFRLDGTTPMNGGRKLSEVARLVVTARVSRSGDAMPQPGDLRGESLPVERARDNVQVSISSTQP
ncbi:hypothetical protein VLK31_30210 [Variovorax sp. H27-G14]|uniref:tetratricopeptide repeat protein n=1 Tax=Variovorax sp. H27-G14 TaxID=3111914 RepID=UPI0038FD13D5